MTSLYANYVLEREGFSTIEDPCGFATYKIVGEECYLRDIYLLPEHRKDGVGRKLADEVSRIALSQGCTKLTGTVCPSTRGSTDSLKALLAYGFAVHESRIDFIVLVKELRNV